MAYPSGALIVLSGPSGVGKGVLCRYLHTAFPQLQSSVSVTTREKRPGEVEGTHYYFVSRDCFQAMIEAGALVEWAEFAGNLYGTPKNHIEAALRQGQYVLLEIDVQGALQIKAHFPQAHLVFIAPPSMEALAQRLHKRNVNDEGDISRRLVIAQVEMQQRGQFDAVVVNDDLGTCQQALAEKLSAMLGPVGTEVRER